MKIEKKLHFTLLGQNFYFHEFYLRKKLRGIVLRIRFGLLNGTSYRGDIFARFFYSWGKSCAKKVIAVSRLIWLRLNNMIQFECFFFRFRFFRSWLFCSKKSLLVSQSRQKCPELSSNYIIKLLRKVWITNIIRLYFKNVININ